VVIEPGLASPLHVPRRGIPGQRDEARAAPPRPKASGNLEAVDGGDADVAQDNIWVASKNGFKSYLAVMRHDDVVPFEFQEVPQCGRAVYAVLDEDDAPLETGG